MYGYWSAFTPDVYSYFVLDLDPSELREVPEPVVDAPVDEPVPSSEEEATAEPEPEQDPTEELGG